LAVAQGARRAKEEDLDRRLLLPEQKLKKLWDHRRGDYCAGGVWNAWHARNYPRLQMSGVREEVYVQKEHDSILTKKSFWVDREDLVVASLGVDASALEEVFGVRAITIRTCL
jgi:hypothetical protein